MEDDGGRAARQVSGRAVAVLVLGVASLISCFPLPAIGALLVAPGARRQIAASGGAIGGEQLIKVGRQAGAGGSAGRRLSLATIRSTTLSV